MATGISSAAPDEMVALGDVLLFPAFVPGVGRELYTLCSGCFLGGVCQPFGAPNPEDPCLVCSPENPNAWSIQAAASCDDDDKCTDGDVCDDSGGCAGTAVICPNAAQCATQMCDEATGGCIPLPLENGTLCNDGDACSTIDTCVNGGCLGGAPVICPAAPACQTAACNPNNGVCTNSPVMNGTVCNDKDPCTLADVCNGGACQGAAKVCPAKVCNTAACDKATGACQYTPAPGVCDDGDPCTTTSDHERHHRKTRISSCLDRSEPARLVRGGLCTNPRLGERLVIGGRVLH